MTISQFAAPGTPTSAAASQGPSSMSYGNNENIPFDQVLGIYNNDSEPIPTLSMYQQIDSPNSKWGWASRLIGVEAGYLHGDCSMFWLEVEF